MDNITKTWGKKRWSHNSKIVTWSGSKFEHFWSFFIFTYSSQKWIESLYVGFCLYTVIYSCFEWDLVPKNNFVAVILIKNNLDFDWHKSWNSLMVLLCQTQVSLACRALCSLRWTAQEGVGSMSKTICMAKSFGSEKCCFFKELELSSTDLHQNSFAKLESYCFHCLGLQRGWRLFVWIILN